jgi:hydrogenase maturation protein HypF
MTPVPVLVMGIGNPSRGDDALGPLFVERANRSLEREVQTGRVELLTDFQLQIEHALDLTGRERVVFVDASVQAAPPFEFSRVTARRDASHTSHALSPAAVLDAHRCLGGEPPEAWVLAIRGERFELGDALSAAASRHLDAAVEFFVTDVRSRELEFSGQEAALRRPRATIRGRRIELSGIVQGVGLRPWVFRTARALGLRGEVWNTPGNVSIEAFGSAASLDGLVSALQHAAPAAARIRSVRVCPIAVRDAVDFTIAPSKGSPREGLPVELVLPPDLASCAACLAEVDDPESRFFRYPFTSCTECGPRLSVARTLPYDRASTTFATFAPCSACAREYADPADRRFHSQTVACPACGPRLWFVDAADPALRSPAGPIEDVRDAIGVASSRLLAGAILGVQGLGAFHLVCDATRADVVAVLRERKQRDQQPFAVLVADLALAEELAELDASARAALLSPARPIVLVPARPSRLAAAVNGPSQRVGLMLPYTPLYHRLARQVGRPLVVTSGNASGGPPIVERAEACQALAGLADAFLFHDRPIARRVEDSVVAASSAGGIQILRRARGFAPSPIRLPAGAPEPLLAVGGHMKNTACFVVGDEAYLTPHWGDLGFFESEQAWQRELGSFERLLGVSPQVLAHDLHPGYASTRWALARPARRHIGVQHHVAHVLAAVAELHIDEPVVGVVYDGSGWGPDQSAWGAEILLVDGARWSRASSFRPLSLAGGERTLREVWRTALGALHAAFGDESLALSRRLPVFAGIAPAALRTVLRMIETGVEVVPVRGMGRWFDAVGALTLELPRASFDAHVAIAFEEAAADLQSVAAYPVGLPAEIAADDAPLNASHEVDLRPTVRALVEDLLDGCPQGIVSARFHRSIVGATADVVERVLSVTGVKRVVLSGGSFQNRWLARGLSERLGWDRVRMARDVPVNDGGLALGQAWAAVLALGAASA